MNFDNNGLSFPSSLPDQQAVLIGVVVDSDSELDGMPVYYIHWRGDLLVGSYNDTDGQFTPQYTPTVDGGTMAEKVHELVDVTPSVEFSLIGSALETAWSLYQSGSGILGVKQAHVFALYHAGFGRGDIAEILNITSSTVDSHRYDAVEKVDSAKQFVQRLHEVEGDSNPT